MKFESLFNRGWLCLCLAFLILSTGCSATRVATGSIEQVITYRLDLDVLSSFDETLLASLRPFQRSIVTAESLQVDKMPWQFSAIVKVNNDGQFHELRSRMANGGIVITNFIRL